MRILGVRHLTVAVKDGSAAAATFGALFGTADAAEPAIVRTFGVATRDIALGGSTLQLASPISPDSALKRFIERKGEGFYNIALDVADLDAAVEELRSSGVRVSDPVEAPPGMRSAFITAAATHGLSVQLVQAPPEPVAAPPDDPAGSAEAPNPAEPTRGLLDLTPDEWSDKG